MRRRPILVLLAALGLSLAVVQAQYARDLADELQRTPAGRALFQVYAALSSSYLNDVDEAALVEGAIQGMVGALEDPFTSYATPEETARARQERSGAYGGIGASFAVYNTVTETGAQVTNVYQGSPADRAGLRPGDIVVSVDGVNVERATVDEVISLVRGPQGTAVTLGVRRAGQAGVLSLSAVRETIELAFVESAVLPNQVGYIRLNTFESHEVYSQLLEHLSDLRAREIDSLILDLRDNGGGYLNQAILVADLFLSEGDIAFQRSQGVVQRLAGADPNAFSLPMVVLVNRGSASAAEIVAGALQDNGRALVVGERSFGKGVGQSLVALANGGELKFVTFEWLTPRHRSIQHNGITPDIQARDTRLPEAISLQGTGADPGQEVAVYVDGKHIGSALADADGEFMFVEPVEPPHLSDVPGEALVDLGSDNILSTAHAAVLRNLAGAR